MKFDKAGFTFRIKAFGHYGWRFWRGANFLCFELAWLEIVVPFIWRYEVIFQHGKEEGYSECKQLYEGVTVPGVWYGDKKPPEGITTTNGDDTVWLPVKGWHYEGEL
jgi:hypothetical protein